MTKQSPYVKSNYPRIPGDYYRTVDTRATDGLAHHFLNKEIRIVDPCSPNGSSIVDHLQARGYRAAGTPDAFASRLMYAPRLRADYVVTNPPFSRPLVDQILRHLIDRVARGELSGVAALMRTNFDHAKTRADMFEKCPHYYGQIKLRFRLWWSDERKEEPIHSYVWHIWHWGRASFPRVLYYTPPYDPRYVVKKKARLK